MYTFDTNVIIYYLDRDENVWAVVRGIVGQNAVVYVSAMSEIELFGFPKLSEEEMLEIDGVLRTMSVVPVDSQIARLAGEIRRSYGLKVPDSAVAATALYTGSTLLTRNVRDFKKIPLLRLQGV